MSKNNDFDAIMQEITSGFTGDPNKDRPYLEKKCEEYNEHEMAKEILRACGRLMYEMLPEDELEEWNNTLDNQAADINATLDKVRLNIYKKKYDKALKIAEELVKNVEDLNLFQDDQMSEYHQFDEFFEEILYAHIYNPTKDLRDVQMIPYTQIYTLYGSILVELKRTEEARNALQKGLRWNPINFKLMSEYVETFKMEGDMDTFFAKTLDAFKIAIHAHEVARCFRNLGYYFVEKELYPVAISAYLLSMDYEEDSQQVQSELYYINQVAGDIEEPSYEDIKKYAEEYGFPTGADEDILGLAYAYGKSYAEDGENEFARYFFSILYELTEDDDIKELLDELPVQE